MRRTLSLLVALACSVVAVPSFADEPASAGETRTAPVSNAGGAIAPSSDRGLAQIHTGTTSQSGASSGRGREVELASDKAPKTSRPVATPRALRKMNADRAMAAVDPQIRACASTSTSPSATTFPLRLSVTPNGEVESSELATGRVPAPVLACVVEAVGKVRFASPGAAGASVVLPITVPARPAPQKEAEPEADAK